MACVVLLRGVNVGGHKAFRPAALAREMADLDVINIGAAGTFVVRAVVGQTTLRAELRQRLAFKTEIIICSARELLELTEAAFPDSQDDKDVRRFVSVLSRRPRKQPRLPLQQPAGDDWQVQVVRVLGRFALSLRRRTRQAPLYPNEVIEKYVGVPATTRNWNTVSAIRDILGTPRS
jgi:uncharacterized protein (DUF1697 family)